MSTISSTLSYSPPAAVLRTTMAARARHAAAFASADIASATAAGEGLPVEPVEEVKAVWGVTGRGTAQPDTVELSLLATGSPAAVATTAACSCGKGNCKGGCKDVKAGQAASTQPLTDEQKQQIDKLRQRDEHVKQHEAAHLAAAGSLARSGPKYEYTKGPDGKHYAVGGHVDIDTSAGATPEETIAKAQRIKAAATAPSDPSGQDHSVAAGAAALEAKARGEQAQAAAEKAENITAAPAAGTAVAEPKTKPLPPTPEPQTREGQRGQPIQPGQQGQPFQPFQQAQALGLIRSEQLVQAIRPMQRKQSNNDDTAAKAFAALVKNAYAAAGGSRGGAASYSAPRSVSSASLS